MTGDKRPFAPMETPMQIITTQAALESFCAAAARAPYVAVDTEFVRERTYWAQLCLLQMALPGKGDDNAVVIDPIGGQLDLTPVWALMANPAVVKVFHAARQDIEIFWHDGGIIPNPIFDTQIAAMVCGYGEQVGYETLVRALAKVNLDKSSRFTDWSHRPLSDKQLSYALADVTHLRVIYEKLSAQLHEKNRTHWIAEEMAALTDPGVYHTEPAEAWRRLKPRSSSGKFLAVLRELAEWREAEAQARNVPRGRMLKDDALLEVAAMMPRNTEELQRSRLLFREGRRPEVLEAILAAVNRALALPREAWPVVEETAPPRPGAGAVVELLKVLLRARADEIGVAPRLLASTEDLDVIATQVEPDCPALHGWRREAFGADALRLKRGELALAVGPKGVIISTRT